MTDRRGLQSGGTIADVYEGLPEAPVAPAAEPSSFRDVFGAARVYARSDRADANDLRINRGYAPIVQALGLDESENPAGFYDFIAGIPAASLVMGAVGYKPHVRGDQEQRIASMIRERRARDPGFLAGTPDTVAGLNAKFINDEKVRRAGAAATMGRAQGASGQIASFLGGAAETTLDPINLGTLPIGGGGKTFLSIVAREALLNGAIEAAQAPIVARNRATLGEDYTAGDFLESVGYAAVGGGLFGGAGHVGGKVAGRAYDATVAQLFAAMPAGVQRRWADRMKVGDQPIGEFFNNLSDADASRFSRDLRGGNLTPDERAAATVLDREADIQSRSAFQGTPAGDAVNAGGLADTLRALAAREPLPPEPAIAVGSAGQRFVEPAIARGAAAPERSSADIAGSGDGAIDSYIAKTRQAESSGDDSARARTSSAAGRYQFTDGTWIEYYRRRYGRETPASEALAAKLDPRKQEALMRDLTRDNGAALDRARLPVNDGTLYLAHFLGPADAVKVLRADPARAVEGLVDARSIASNRSILQGKTASQVVQWAMRKMGGDAAALPIRPGWATGGLVDGGDLKVAQLREEALQLQQGAIGERPLPGGGTLPPMYARTFKPSQILVDADRFQFKSGGDEFGVTDRLQGVTEWNPMQAGRLIVWEDNAGRTFAADGHQRSGLARRLEAVHGADIDLDAIVLREADGVSAEDARVYGALKNIAEGTGSAIDAAKVLRDAGPELVAHLPPKSPLVRDGAALARLSDEAFGAVYNGVLDADKAAVIGHLLPDQPDAHAGMVDLLVKLDPANRGQAESIVRQGIAAGFHRETQAELFGAREMVSSLFLERAKVLERGLARLRKMKLVYGTAAREADTLERAGSTIARDASAKEAQANAEAIEIVSRLAFSTGPVSDALNAAAAKLAAGARLGDVTGEFANAVRGLDLQSVARNAGEDGGSRLAPDGAGRGGDAGEADADLPTERGDPSEPSLAELEDAGQVSMFDVGQAQRFSDPIHGDGPRAQIESLTHDVQMDLEAAPRDPNIASRNAMAAQLAAGSPLRPVGVDTEGTIGMGLFDAVDQPTFRLDLDGDDRAAGDLLAELDADDAAIDVLQACMVPTKVSA